MRRYWTTVEMRRFREAYPDKSLPDLCVEFGRTRAALKMMAGKLGLRKSPLWEPVRFKVGHKTWNAGKKWKAGGRSKLTQFKKGQRFPRQRPVGSERSGRDGVEIKIAEPNVWIPKARFVWKRDVGPIPKGYLVRLRDRKREIVPSNLMLVTRAEHIRLNYRPRKPKQPPQWMRPLLAMSEGRGSMRKAA